MCVFYLFKKYDLFIFQIMYLFWIQGFVCMCVGYVLYTHSLSTPRAYINIYIYIYMYISLLGQTYSRVAACGADWPNLTSKRACATADGPGVVENKSQLLGTPKNPGPN